MSGTNGKPGHSLALVDKFAARVGVEPAEFVRTVKATVLKTKDRQATNEELTMFLAIADRYGLDVWTKQIHGFVDKGAIVPIVGIDGWNHLEHTHPDFHQEIVEIAPVETWVQADKDAKPCPPWITVTIERKDGTKHSATEYLDECYQPPRNGFRGPWQSHTKRMLRHKARIQAIREAFGYGGIYDQDEADRIIEAQEARQSYDLEAEPVELISAAQHAQLLDLAELKGLSEGQLQRQLTAKRIFDGSLDAMPLAIFETVMGGLRTMPDKTPPDEPNAAAPAAEASPAETPPIKVDGNGEVVDEEDLPGYGPENLNEWPPADEPAQEQPAQASRPTMPTGKPKASPRQLARIALLMKERECDTEAMRNWMRSQWNIGSRAQLDNDQAGQLIEYLSNLPGRLALEERGAA